MLKYINKNVFATFLIKITKKNVVKRFFMLKYINKNVFTTFLIKITKKILQNVFLY
jgi:hypothetical protein